MSPAGSGRCKAVSPRRTPHHPGPLLPIALPPTGRRGRKAGVSPTHLVDGVFVYSTDQLKTETPRRW